MAFIDAIDDFKNQVSLTITRRAVNTVLKGRKVDGAESTFTTDAVLVPVTGKRLMQMIDSYHAQDIKEIFSATELKVQDKNTGEGDRFTVDGTEYTLVESDEWDTFDEVFWHAIAIGEPV